MIIYKINLMLQKRIILLSSIQGPITKSYCFSAKKYTGSIDQSTTGTKFSLFELDGTLVDQQITPHKQITPHQGWLQHNPSEIMKSVDLSISNVINRHKQKDPSFKLENIIGVGICNQRQTVVCWDRKTGEPLHNAIVWSDSRTADICSNFANKCGDFKQITGLPVSTYFSLFKIFWILENNPEIQSKLKSGQVLFGTIDAWVTYNLTGKFVTDLSNASRTYLCNISEGKWDQRLLQLSNIPQKSLPTIVNSFEDIGSINRGPLQGIHLKSILGDQQSSAYAHNISGEEMKITYGTGCFMMNNMGNKPNFHDAFVTTVLWANQGIKNYGYEASIQCGGGTINWAKRINLFQKYDELNNLPQCPQQLFFLPSFGSIYSPYWKPNTAGSFIGLGFNTERQHLMQSIMQAITFRIYDNIKSSQFSQIKKVIVDGGLCQNQQFMQMNADLFNKQIEVRTLDTCWGVAKGAIKASNIKIQQKSFSTTNYHPQAAKSEYFKQKYEMWDAKKKHIYNI